MTSPSHPDPVPRRRLKRTEYDRLAELGAFEDERVELIHGELLTMSPIGGRHVWTVRKLTTLLGAAMLGRADLVPQCSFAASDDSEPQPDLALVAPDEGGFGELAASALLLIEVAETSLAYDLGLKAALYAASDVREYWVVDLATRSVIVHRDSDGTRWEQITTVRPGGTVSPVAFPDLALPLEAFVPAASDAP